MGRVKPSVWPRMVSLVVIALVAIGVWRVPDLIGGPTPELTVPPMSEPTQEVGMTGSPAKELSPAEFGAQLAEEQGCMSCHGLDGSAMVGPSWLGLFGSERALEDRNSVVAGEDYLAKSIREPDAAVVKGYPKVMPAAYSFFSIEDVEASIGHIKILVVADPSPGPGLGPTAQLDQRVVPAHEPTSRLTDAQLGADSSSRNCAVCHGENGEGGAIGPSLTSVEMQAQEDDNVRQVVNDGIEGTAMPAWAGRLLITQDIEDVITFLRSVQ